MVSKLKVNNEMGFHRDLKRFVTAMTKYTSSSLILLSAIKKSTAKAL